LATCPKCNKKLRLRDWRPECPHCGTNVVYYNFEEQFYIDAKGAELDAAKIRVKWTRVKTAFIGSKLLVARLSLSILPIIAALLPLGKLSISLPLFEKNIQLNIIGLFSAFSDGTFGYLSALRSSAVIGGVAAGAARIILGLSAAAAFALLVFLFQLLCFISIKKMTFIISAAGALGAAASIYTIIAINSFSKAAASEIFTVKIGFGGFAVIAAFAVIVALNAAVVKKGVKINYVEGDLYRVEVAKKLKRKEITLDEIPQPVYSPAAMKDEPEKETGFVDGGDDNG